MNGLGKNVTRKDLEPHPRFNPNSFQGPRDRRTRDQIPKTGIKRKKKKKEKWVITESLAPDPYANNSIGTLVAPAAAKSRETR
ncbi:hypothetical protein K0M31_009765 [Melipona bicolor]|uniref:Uncharacterized protein n=1 Tax=Melipona bicolor TaxID=60889 RepID=A0AA40FMP0_9HYME|nr:hypothetical protein K0M31_009765 [Melipona bicolor]